MTKMRKLCVILTGLLLTVTGCAESYSVYVNGFAKVAESIPSNAHIFVSTNPDSDNPLFDNEIKVKIVKLLASRGYQPTDNPANEYLVTFSFGVVPRLDEDVEFISTGFGFHGRHHFIGSSGYYAPYVRTTWDQWLRVKVYRGDEVVWVGEAVTTKYYADIRRAVDYLVAAVFQYMGKDTGRQQVMTINAKDPRITVIGAYAE